MFSIILFIKHLVTHYWLNKPRRMKRTGMVNVEKIDQRRHFFGGSLSTLTSLFQRQRSTISVSLKLIVQKYGTFLFLSSLI